MLESINCPSCGASNQFPEGKTSMFCAFCGSAIESINKESSQSSSLITKPEISKKKIGKGSEYVAKFKFDKQNNLKDKGHFIDTEIVLDEGGELSLIDRNIKSLNEITLWFSDNELNEIKILNLNKNKINSLNGIERFQSLETLDLSNNEIVELPKENLFLKNLFRIYLSGNPIEENKSQSELDYYSNIRYYIPTIKKIIPLPDVVGNLKLSYSKMEINSVKEISDLYSKKELDTIRILDLSNNNIKTLNGLSDFISTEIDLSNNDLTLIDELPKFKKKYLDDASSISLNFINNKKLKQITNSAINNFYDIKISDATLFLRGCDNFDYESLSNINFNQIFKTANNEYTRFSIYVNDNAEMPISLKKIGFINDNSTWGIGFGYKKSGCFIATATMGSYDHPEVMKLRNFRDNWILEKKWGENFVTWYYHYGAIGAKYIEKSFLLKKVCYLLIVKPLVLLTKLIKC